MSAFIDLFEFPQPTSKYMRASRGKVLFSGDVFVNITNVSLRVQVFNKSGVFVFFCYQDVIAEYEYMKLDQMAK